MTLTDIEHSLAGCRTQLESVVDDGYSSLELQQILQHVRSFIEDLEDFSYMIKNEIDVCEEDNNE